MSVLREANREVWEKTAGGGQPELEPAGPSEDRLGASAISPTIGMKGRTASILLVIDTFLNLPAPLTQNTSRHSCLMSPENTRYILSLPEDDPNICSHPGFHNALTFNHTVESWNIVFSYFISLAECLLSIKVKLFSCF